MTGLKGGSVADPSEASPCQTIMGQSPRPASPGSPARVGSHRISCPGFPEKSHVDAQAAGVQSVPWSCSGRNLWGMIHLGQAVLCSPFPVQGYLIGWGHQMSVHILHPASRGCEAPRETWNP